jgi:hypothetical protein
VGGKEGACLHVRPPTYRKKSLRERKPTEPIIGGSRSVCAPETLRPRVAKLPPSHWTPDGRAGSSEEEDFFLGCGRGMNWRIKSDACAAESLLRCCCAAAAAAASSSEPWDALNPPQLFVWLSAYLSFLPDCLVRRGFWCLPPSAVQPFFATAAKRTSSRASKAVKL